MIKFSLSHNEVQRQCQKGMTPLLLAVPGNEQQKHNDDQIPGIKILGQQVLQKSSHTGIAAVPAGLRHRRWWRGRWAAPPLGVPVRMLSNALVPGLLLLANRVLGWTLRRTRLRWLLLGLLGRGP